MPGTVHPPYRYYVQHLRIPGVSEAAAAAAAAATTVGAGAAGAAVTHHRPQAESGSLRTHHRPAAVHGGATRNAQLVQLEATDRQALHVLQMREGPVPHLHPESPPQDRLRQGAQHQRQVEVRALHQIVQDGGQLGAPHQIRVRRAPAVLLRLLPSRLHPTLQPEQASEKLPQSKFRWLGSADGVGPSGQLRFRLRLLLVRIGPFIHLSFIMNITR